MLGSLVATLLIARALAAQHATPPAQHKTWASIAVLAARRARDGSGDAEVLVAMATRGQRNFSPGGNVSFHCSDDGGRGWVAASPQGDLRGEQFNTAHLVLRCPASGYASASRREDLRVRCRRSPARPPARGAPLDDDVADFVLDAPTAPPAASRLTSCLEPVYRPRRDAVDRFLRYYRAVGVERFVVWDGERALESHLGDARDVAYHGWTFADVLRNSKARTAKGGPVGQHLAMAYCAFAYGGDARMLLSVDLDELVTCADLGTSRDLAAALDGAAAAAGDDNPCACLLRWLYDGPLGGPDLPGTVVARQMNRKCVVAPGQLEDANFHRPACRGRRGVFQVDGGACWINHYRDEALSGKRPQDAIPLPGGPEARADLAWAAALLASS